MNHIRYGIDPGERSLALAAVEFDAEGVPINVRGLSLSLHDGGTLDEKTLQSRLAARGEKRRGRRRLNRRHSRRGQLRDVLDNHGFPVTEDAQLTALIHQRFPNRFDDARFPFQARAALLEPLGDERLSRYLFAIAALHIERHRGWRNPWVSLEALKRKVQHADGTLNRTEQGALWCEAVGRALGSPESPRTLGESAVFAIARGRSVRPTKTALKRARGEKATLSSVHNEIRRVKDVDNLDGLVQLAKHFVLPVRPFQEDLIYELLLCAQTQGFLTTDAGKQAVDEIIAVVMAQETPRISAELVGPCALLHGERRAPKFLPSVQELTVRGYVANLRLRAGRKYTNLADEQREHLTQLLLTAKDRQSIRLADLEAELQNKFGSDLKLGRSRDARYSEDGEAVYGGRPPVDLTHVVFAALPKSNPLKQWWEKTTRDEHELLLAFFDDTTTTKAAQALYDTLALDEEINEELELLYNRLPAGRSAYSQKAVALLLKELRAGADHYDAQQAVLRKLSPKQRAAAGVGDTHARWDTLRINHPVVQVSRSELSPMLREFDRALGKPAKIHVEVARQTLGRKQSWKKDQRHKEREARNISAREGVGEFHELQGRYAMRKLRIIADQNDQCAYQVKCEGEELHPLQAEIDHIIPRTVGASNARENLVAVCANCNRDKGDKLLTEWVDEAKIKEIIERVKGWRFELFDRTLAKAMIRRITAKDAADFDERSVTTTAQVAIELRQMVRHRYQLVYGDAEEDLVGSHSIPAKIVREARESAQLNALLPGGKANTKSRLDHRHHLVDAVVIACIDKRVIKVLQERASLREFARLNAGSDYQKELLEQVEQTGQANAYFMRWLNALTQLGGQMAELFARQRPSHVSRNGSRSELLLELDVIAPRFPKRLKGYSGFLHEETAHPVRSKTVGEAWEKKDLQSILDPHISAAMFLASMQDGKQQDLPKDPQRVLAYAKGTLSADTSLVLAPLTNGGDPTPSVLVRGAAYIAGGVHHVRIYRWEEDPKGQILQYIPIYNFDVAQLLRFARRSHAKQGGMHPTVLPLLPECLSLRYSAAANVRGARLRELFVRECPPAQAGWLVAGDELLLAEPGVVRAVPKGSMPPEWQQETRWVYQGTTGRGLSVVPLLLSKSLPRAADGTERKPPAACRLTWDDLTKFATIVRRDAAGRPTYVQLLAELAA